jgi:hypothetical protein
MSFMLLRFNEDGLLPPGDYALTLEQLKASHLVTGEASEFTDTWDHDWRLNLVEQVEILIQQLWTTGVEGIYLDGSFVEDKSHPNDIDGYFDCDKMYFLSGELQRDLNALDPYKIWTWDHRTRKPYRNYAKKQLPMWHRYRVELYPHYQQSSGIRDKYGNELQFPSAFRLSRSADHPKGIIKIIKSED